MKIDVDALVKEAIETAKDAYGRKEFYRAEALLDQIRRVGHQATEIDHMYGLSLHHQGKNEKAKGVLETLVADYPDSWEFRNSLGVVHSVMKSPEAISHFWKAVKLDSTQIVAQSNLALEYQAAEKYDDAMVILRKAICKGGPYEYLLWFNFGNVYLDQLILKKAAGCFRKSRELKNDFKAASWNLASVLLMDKQYEEGWLEYESRWSQFPNFTKLRERFADRPLWEGQDLKGKTILLYVEQGAGDAIQFVRFTEQLKELGATVYFEWSDHYERGDMHTLLGQVEWVDRIVDPDDEVIYEDYDFDYHQSVASLPRVLRIHSDDQLWRAPYLSPNVQYAPELQEQHWSQYRDVKRVGIVWAGSPSHHDDPKRSCPVARFEPLVQEGVQLFSLQKDTRKRVWPGFGKIDLAEGFEEMPIVDLAPMMVNYNSTANLISQMDVIVSVDTAVAHLAGAMGKPVFLMLPKRPDWRWSVDEDQTPWYPSMKLFRDDGHSFERAADHLLL